MATAQVWALNGRQKVLEPSARYAERRRCLVHRERAHYRLAICTHADISFLSLNARMKAISPARSSTIGCSLGLESREGSFKQIAYSFRTTRPGFWLRLNPGVQGSGQSDRHSKVLRHALDARTPSRSFFCSRY
jgi:hypothetical protein